ncbi:MAG TPA: HAMP domain-containing sensor histidine kinase, partial [Methylomirabilota bacterium]|nr:HAMP domain-containing sensor histidine kinase [Methylomirabilota bacterium]
ENIWLQTEMYKKVKETERMQKEFIDIAAHELKTPIQPILGLTEILHSQIKDVKQKELLDTIYRNAKRLNRLTEDVLDLTKIESQSLQLHTEQFNLREMILNTIADSRNEIKKEYKDSIVLELVSKNDIFIEADRGRLNQVVSNLLNNAIKFTNKEGIIITTAEKKDTHVVISVKDTGTGIDPEILPRLFTRFATKSESKTGTGLGLFISKSIVEAHGGRIRAENNADAKGATFTFRLPLEC